VSGRLIGRALALSLLAVVGASNAVGSTLELGFPRLGRAVAAVGRVALASPAPKVFCKMGEIEPFARSHTVELRYDDARVSYAIDDARAIHLRGPYALRNVYGAALVFAPLLPARTTEAVVRRGVCDGMAFSAPRSGGHGPVRSVLISSSPRGAGGGAETRVEVTCAR
jgi:hypothetical protein